jgi:hypothetical protein
MVKTAFRRMVKTHHYDLGRAHPDYNQTTADLYNEKFIQVNGIKDFLMENLGKDSPSL